MLCLSSHYCGWSPFCGSPTLPPMLWIPSSLSFLKALFLQLLPLISSCVLKDIPLWNIISISFITCFHISCLNKPSSQETPSSMGHNQQLRPTIRQQSEIRGFKCHAENSREQCWVAQQGARRPCTGRLSTNYLLLILLRTLPGLQAASSQEHRRDVCGWAPGR